MFGLSCLHNLEYMWGILVPSLRRKLYPKYTCLEKVKPGLPHAQNIKATSKCLIKKKAFPMISTYELVLYIFAHETGVCARLWWGASKHEADVSSAYCKLHNRGSRPSLQKGIKTDAESVWEGLAQNVLIFVRFRSSLYKQYKFTDALSDLCVPLVMSSAV